MMEFIHKIYCNFVTVITELITGLDHSNLKLWNVGKYLMVQNKVETIVRCIGFALVALGIVVLLSKKGIIVINNPFGRKNK